MLQSKRFFILGDLVTKTLYELHANFTLIVIAHYNTNNMSSPSILTLPPPVCVAHSALPKGYTMSDPFHIIQKARTAMKSEDVSPALSLTRTHTSEMGYLNLTPPLSPPGSQLQDDWTATSSADEAPQIENKERCLTERFL